MDNFEKVEKLRAHANVSFEEAKQALENSGWDMLDAMIYLERQGKASETERAAFTTRNESTEDYAGAEEKQSDFKDGMKRLGNWCKSCLEKGNANSFCATKEREEIFRVPVTVLALLLIFAFWVVVPLLVVGLFFHLRYHFEGPDIRNVDIDLNKAMDGAADVAEQIKSELSSAAAKEREQP